MIAPRRHHVDEQLPNGSGLPMINHDGSNMIDHRGKTIYRNQYLSTLPLRSDCDVAVDMGKKCTVLSETSVIRTLNTIYGNGGWGMDITREKCVHSAKDKHGRWVVGYVVTVRITLKDGMSYEDCGGGEGINDSPTFAHEKGIKLAVSDAMRRATRHLGERLGCELNGKSDDLQYMPSDNREAFEELEKREYNVLSRVSSDEVHEDDSISVMSNSQSMHTDNDELASKKSKMKRIVDINKLQKARLSSVASGSNRKNDSESEEKVNQRKQNGKNFPLFSRQKNPEATPSHFTFISPTHKRIQRKAQQQRCDSPSNDSIVSCPNMEVAAASKQDPHKTGQFQRHRYRTVYVAPTGNVTSMPKEVGATSVSKQDRETPEDGGESGKLFSTTSKAGSVVPDTKEKRKGFGLILSPQMKSRRDKDERWNKYREQLRSSHSSASQHFTFNQEDGQEESRDDNDTRDRPLDSISFSQGRQESPIRVATNLTPRSSSMVDDIKSMRNRIHRYRSLSAAASTLQDGSEQPPSTPSSPIRQDLLTPTVSNNSSNVASNYAKVISSSNKQFDYSHVRNHSAV